MTEHSISKIPSFGLLDTIIEEQIGNEGNLSLIKGIRVALLLYCYEHITQLDYYFQEG